MAKLLYQGHGSCRIVADNGKVIYIDPYAGEGYDLPADLILVTHQHYDHNKIELVKQNKDCGIITNEEALAGGKHQAFAVDGITVEAVEAGNKNHPSDKCVGYIITVDNIKIYASGDTSYAKQMETFAARDLDYAFLCCDGIYNMGLDEAAKCSDIIKARHTVPIHIKPGELFDEAKAEEFKGRNKLVLKPNREIALGFAPCGYDCANECDEFGATCGGCDKNKGIVSWLDTISAKVCPIYDCVSVKNRLSHCGKCTKLPCALFDDSRDPLMNNEQHAQSIKQRVEFLKKK